jgi:hypothetical protein
LLQMRKGGRENRGQRIWWWRLTGGRVADISQYNIRRVQNEVFVFFRKVHVWLHIPRVTSFVTKMKCWSFWRDLIWIV